jgi:nucleotide-binding universal stress UspA family protein
MSAIRKILVPTDFNQSSDAAIDLAVDLAQALRASIVLMHAVELPMYSYPGAPMIPIVDIQADLTKSAQIGLDTTMKTLKERCPDTISVLRAGPAALSILDVAKEQKVDLIVMGTHGRRGFAHALLGSVAEKIVRASPMPVLTTHEKQTT